MSNIRLFLGKTFYSLGKRLLGITITQGVMYVDGKRVQL